jgi:hypothetical protein
MKTYMHKARRTGTTILIISAVDGELDPGTKDFPTRWYTICEDHKNAAGHPTCDMARSWASTPDAWCEECRSMIEYEMPDVADADICTCEIAFTGHCDACRRDPAVFA